MSKFVPASRLYDVDSRTPIAHPAHQATDADVRNALEEREIRTDGGHSSSDTDQQSERRVHLHTHIDKPGAILEVRPEGQDFASERDMSYLNREEARDVYEQLGSFLGEQCGNDRSVDAGTESEDGDSR